MSEHRVTSETGGSKGQKLARFDLMPPDVLQKIAEQFGRGARKYEDRNWEKGYPWSLSYAAAMRHLTSFWNGEDYDYEDPLWEDDPPHHLDAALFHLMALREFVAKQGRYDDRPHRQTRIDRRPTPKTPSSQQTSGIGRERTVQTRRWEIP